MGWNKVSRLDKCTGLSFFFFFFFTREVGTGERTIPVWILSSWCGSVYVWGISGCVLEIPQYKVHVVEIWEKGAECGTYKRWAREY